VEGSVGAVDLPKPARLPRLEPLLGGPVDLPPPSSGPESQAPLSAGAPSLAPSASLPPPPPVSAVTTWVFYGLVASIAAILVTALYAALR
jgi:hypothetical protein